ncbi:MAG: hypothetical protein MJZ11_13260 [Lachnospiraceae bacterium]|nr:hypothetical protein [Lachnospiraceae bacterium]
MGVIAENNQFIDVICQYTKTGMIIPMRLRIQDSDGLYHVYNVKGYKELTSAGEYKTPYGTISHSPNWRFSCKIQVFDKYKDVELFFNGKDNLWKIVGIK